MMLQRAPELQSPAAAEKALGSWDPETPIPLIKEYTLNLVKVPIIV